MVSRRHRFHGHNSLNYVYRHGTVTRDYHMQLRAIHNQRRKTYRVAIIVSRKVNKSAVRRNRIRRRLYEVIRLHQAEISAPYDLVLTVFSDQLADVSSDKLTSEVQELLQKADVVKVAT